MVSDFLILAIPTAFALASLHWLGKWDAERMKQELKDAAMERVLEAQLEIQPK